MKELPQKGAPILVISIEKFLKRHRRVALDTSVFIYFIEEHPVYFPFCDRVFEGIEKGSIKASTATLSLLEILVQPYRMKKDDLVYKFYSLFSTYPNLAWVELNLNVADIAARLRAEYNLKTPDSIQAASAIASGATGLICNDKGFKKVKEIECLVLDDLLKVS